MTKTSTDAQIVGSVSFINGDAQQFTDAKAYLDAKGIEYVEKTGTTNDEVSLAADALIAAGCEAVFTPTNNTVMTAELAIFEKYVANDLILFVH